VIVDKKKFFSEKFNINSKERKSWKRGRLREWGAKANCILQEKEKLFTK